MTAIELDEGHPLRAEALERLAFNPVLFAELRERFGKELPSDVNLKHYLIQQKSFLPKAAEEVIRVYRENLELVTVDQEEYDEGGTTKNKENLPVIEAKPASTTVQPAPASILSSSQAKPGIHEFSFPLSLQRNVKATITIHGDQLKRRDLEFLRQKVADLIQGFEDEEPEPQARTAMWPNRITISL